MLFRRSSITGTAVALITPDSERTFATHLGAAVELGANDLMPEHFSNYDILYLEGYLINDKALVEKACRLARENKMEIALDLASYNVVDAKLGDFREIIEKYVDIVFANEDEAKSFTGMEREKALDKIVEHSNIAIVKIGKEGSMIRHGRELIRTGSLPVVCLDTTGAGDLYASGFLYGYANELPLDKCGLLGALLAGNVIQDLGARIPHRKWKSIKRKAGSIIND